MDKLLTLNNSIVSNNIEKSKLTVKIGNAFSLRVSYISDMHLENSCKNPFNKIKVINKIKYKFERQRNITLIAGDTANDPKLFKLFFGQLKNWSPIFVTLGNHELFAFSNESIEEIVKIYKQNLNKNQFLVHNNLYLFTPSGISEISFKELKSITVIKLKEKAKNTYLAIFGGIGFSGKNLQFNANNKIYGKKSYIDRDEEIKLTSEFYFLYKKVAKALNNKKVIVLTHMPVECWYNNTNDLVDGFIYVNGHTHRNRSYTNGKWIIYSDNQVGNSSSRLWFLKKASFWSQRIKLKYFDLNEQILDCFSEYGDGIHEITKDQYEMYLTFLSGKNNHIFSNLQHLFFFSKLKREYPELYMVKKTNTTCFLR